MPWMFVNKRQVYRTKMAWLEAARAAQSAWHAEESRVFFSRTAPADVVAWARRRHEVDRNVLNQMQWGLDYFNRGLPFDIKSGAKLRGQFEAVDKVAAANTEAVHAADLAAFAADVGEGSAERRQALLARHAKERAYLAGLVASTYRETGGL